MYHALCDNVQEQCPATYLLSRAGFFHGQSDEEVQLDLAGRMFDGDAIRGEFRFAPLDAQQLIFGKILRRAPTARVDCAGILQNRMFNSDSMTKKMDTVKAFGIDRVLDKQDQMIHKQERIHEDVLEVKDMTEAVLTRTARIEGMSVQLQGELSKQAREIKKCIVSSWAPCSWSVRVGLLLPTRHLI